MDSFQLSSSTHTSSSPLPDEILRVNDPSIHFLHKPQSSFKLDDSYSKTNDNKSASETFSLSSHMSSKFSFRIYCESKFMHVRSSRFTSTSTIFRDRSEKSSSSTSNDSSLHPISRKNLGAPKTHDLSNHKCIKKLQELMKHLVLLTLAHLSLESPRSKLQNTLSLHSRLSLASSKVLLALLIPLYLGIEVQIFLD